MGLVTDIVEPEEWLDTVEGFAVRAGHLPVFASREMLRLTGDDTDDLDLAAVVRTAGRPGLKDRILAYRTAMKAKSNEKREASRAG